LLIIRKSVRPKIRNGIVVLADISENAQQPLQAGAVRLPELPAVSGHEQRNYQSGVLLDETVQEAAASEPGELQFQVARRTAVQKRLTQLLDLLATDQV